jgi:hypothetical protein
MCKQISNARQRKKKAASYSPRAVSVLASKNQRVILKFQFIGIAF